MLNPVKHFFGGPTVMGQTLAGAPVGSITLFGTGNFTPLTAEPSDFVRVGQKMSTGRQANGRWRFVTVGTEASSQHRGSGKGRAQITRRDYTAPTLDMWTFVLDTIVTPGFTLVLEITFKNVRDLSPQILNQSFYYTFPKTGTAATAQDAWNNIRNQVNNDSMCRDKIEMRPATGANALTITAKLPPYNKQQRYEWAPVEFEANLSIITKQDTSPFTPLVNDRQKWGTVTHTTRSSIGCGYGPVMSDLEKRCHAYQGVTNITHFPVITPTLFVDPTHTYNVFTIDQQVGYRAADDIWHDTNEQVIIAQDTAGTVPAEFETYLLHVIPQNIWAPTSIKSKGELTEAFNAGETVTVEYDGRNKKKPVTVRV